MKRQDTTVCPSCGSANLTDDYDTDETVCSECGLVIQEHASEKRAEWQSGSGHGSAGSTGKDLSTVIGGGRKDAMGSEIPVTVRQRMQSLKKWQQRLSTPSYGLKYGGVWFDRLAEAAHLPQSTKESAIVIYRRALAKGLQKHHNIATLTTASIYASCRLTGVPRTLKDFVKATGLSQREIGRAYAALKSSLDLNVPIDDPIKYVSKIASGAGVSVQTQQLAIQVIKAARDRHLITGKLPKVVAAAAIYFASLQNKSEKNKNGIGQRRISSAATVSDVALRYTFHQLKEAFGDPRRPDFSLKKR